MEIVVIWAVAVALGAAYRLGQAHERRKHAASAQRDASSVPQR